MACVAGTNIVTDGLVLHLDAANSKSYPGSGTTWSDLSGNGNDGTTINSPTYSSTNAGLFNFSTNEYGYVHEDTTIKPTDFITVNFVCRSAVSSISNCRPLGDWHQTGLYDRWIMYINGTTVQWLVNGTAPTGWTIVPNIWVILTGTYDGTTLKLYVNGNLFSETGKTGAMDGGDGNRPIRFGGQGFYAGTNSAGSIFDGDIASFSVYNRALTAAEIKQNFEAIRGRYGI